MEAFEPVVNLLVLMSALSIAAERLTNAIKLRLAPSVAKKDHERQVAAQALGVSVLLAFAVRADLFQILSHLDAPWETLGWVRPGVDGTSLAASVQAWGGMIMTGIALGFGSKFWHDVLDIVYGARNSLRAARQ